MATRTFDTYKAVKDLEQVGIDEDVARVMVGMVGDAMTENVATKTDIADLRAEIRELEARMTVRFVWMALGIVGLTSAITSLITGIMLQLQ